MTAAAEGRRSPLEWRIAGGRDAWALGIIACVVLCGGLLRAFMAQGDLWLDEVWSLDLVRPLPSALGVFTAISHDNNHFLNSLWLFWLGPDRAPWTYRAPSVLFGTLSIGLAAAIVWRRSRAGAVVAALLAAVALPFVVYGSEARGYGGLIASMLLAIAAFDRCFEAPEGSRRARLVLGVAIGVGMLFHLTMLATAAVLGLAALIRFAADRPPLRAIDATLTLFRPALVCLLPAMLAIVAGILHHGGFETGDASPATLGTFLRGYGDLMRVTIGAPAFVPLSLCFAVAGLLLLAALRLADLAPARRSMIFAAIVACPAAMLLFSLPNLEFPRYYLVAGVMLLISVAELAGALWDRGTRKDRLLAALLVGLGVAGQAAADESAMVSGRGHYGAALAEMADADGHLRYGTRDTFWIRTVVDAAAHRRGIDATLIPESAFCSQAPEWFIAVPQDMADFTRPAITAGPPACRIRYTLWKTLFGNVLSGMPWSIYRRAEDTSQAASAAALGSDERRRPPY